MQKFFSLFVAVVQEPALASCSNYEDSYNGCDSGSARGSPSLCSTGDDLSADEEAIHVKMRQKGRRWSEVGKNRLVLLLIHIRFVSYAIFCCFQRPKVGFYSIFFSKIFKNDCPYRTNYVYRGTWSKN